MVAGEHVNVINGIVNSSECQTQITQYTLIVSDIEDLCPVQSTSHDKCKDRFILDRFPTLQRGEPEE